MYIIQTNTGFSGQVAKIPRQKQSLKAQTYIYNQLLLLHLLVTTSRTRLKPVRLGCSLKANSTLMNTPHNIQIGSMPPFQIDSVYTASEVLQTAVKKRKATKLHKVKLGIPLEPIVALTSPSQF